MAAARTGKRRNRVRHPGQ